MYWILNMYGKYCVCVCAWGFLHARSIVFVLDMFVLNLSKHYYLGKQPFACNTNRLITVFWFFITLVNSLLLKRFEAAKHLLILRDHLLNWHTEKHWTKTAYCVSLICMQTYLLMCTLCAHENHKSHKVVSFIISQSSSGHKSFHYIDKKKTRIKKIQ